MGPTSRLVGFLAPISNFFPVGRRRISSIRRSVIHLAVTALAVTTRLTYAQDTTVSTIRVRLLTHEFLQSVTLEAYGGLRASAEHLVGPVTVKVRGSCVEIQDSKDYH